MTQQLRVLGRVRLSKDEDEAGTSLERQRESITQWAAMHGHTVIGWAVDSGVSGSVSPFETPELGPWLKPHRLPEWDCLVAYRLDRLARRVIPLNQLFGLVQEHGKTLASVNESLDLSTWVGRLVANVIAGVAEGELEAISQRNKGSHADLRKVGRWHGGVPPYGFSVERRSDGAYLVHDEAEASAIREEILPRILAHQSTNSIADYLNAAGIPTRQQKRWSGMVVRYMLRNRALMGQHEHNGRVVTDDDGMPVQRAEPILTADEFERVQEVLRARSVRAGERNPNPLAGVLFCYLCDKPMYPQGMRRGKSGPSRDYGYYRCSNRQICPARSIRSDTTMAWVQDRLLFEIGDVERRERTYVPGSDHTEALHAVTTAIDTVRRERDLGLYEGDDDGYLARVQRLTARRRELEALPSKPGGFEWRGLGETYAEAWQRMDAAERRTLMLDSGIRVTLAAGVGNEFFGHFYVPDGIQEKIERNERHP